ncbi:MAG: tRNA (N6-threonylcarbamoyladenosine(37)-N6)-methyltransferase TrmO [Lentisphaeria bacterium]|nr:tRNA (N6-threonylcarbamoyladenosine(37)-N6)-methyltransferase TrmO [Lentisphaeria bacterium]
MDISGFEFKPIGVVHSFQKYRYETPRQGVFSGCDGEIELFSEFAGDAIADLAGFERIWVIFCFHLNYGKNWKPKVHPPLPAGGPGRSVFATRSPHRVNPIGLSCVELAGITGNRLHLKHIDMLSGTPVLDIKPYIPEADSFPDSATGWRAEVPAAGQLYWRLDFSECFMARAKFILENSGLDLMNFVEVQLGCEPLDSSRKRVKHIDGDHWVLGCRTWRINFSVDIALRKVYVTGVESNYSAEELLPGTADKYNDKDIHRAMITLFVDKSSVQ